MKLARTLVICVLFAVSVMIYIYQGRLDKEILSISPDEVNRDFSFSPEEKVRGINILGLAKEPEIGVVRAEGEWRGERPVSYLADQKVVDGFAVVVKFASQQTRLRAEKDWAEYGLDKPSLSVQVVTDRGQEGTLEFGAVSPIGKAVYAKWAGERGYILVTPELKAVFDTTLYSVRDKSVFRLRPAETSTIYIEMGPHAYEWKKENGKWFWIEPVEKFGREIPEDRIGLVFRGLSGLNVKEFLDKNTKSDSELGFFIIHDRIRITDDEGGEVTFYFGNEVPMQNAYYGKLENGGTVFLIDRVKVIQLFDLLKAIENENVRLGDVLGRSS